MNIPSLEGLFRAGLSMQSGFACHSGSGAGSLPFEGVGDDKEMRATIFAMAGLAACLGLAGCDNPPTAPAPNVQAVAPPCNCQPQNAVAAKAAPPRTAHRHHAWTASSREQDENYSYQSQSRSTYQGGSEEQSDNQTAQQENGSAEQNVWTDGYGRRHYVATASAAPDDRARLAPWHGYDQDCDDRK
jgi:hypothetical protein